MKKTATLKAVLGISVAAFFAACSSSPKMASSFESRKYNKGYFFNTPGGVKDVQSNNVHYSSNTSATTVSQSPVVAKQENATVSVSKSEINERASAQPVLIVKNVTKHVPIANSKTETTIEHTANSNATESAMPTSTVKQDAPKADIIESTANTLRGGGSCKNWLAALLLCFFLGGLGIHRFYLGYTWQGIVQLLTGGGCGVWALIDFIRIIMKTLKPKNGDYC